MRGDKGATGATGATGAKGDPGAFPGTIFSYRDENNGTVSCDTFCADLTKANWHPGESGSCIAAQLRIHANPSKIADLDRRWIACNTIPFLNWIPNWNLLTDVVQCHCLAFPD